MQVGVTNENGDGSHKTVQVQPPVGRPFAPGHDPRRNAGGRPNGLAALARQAVGDGEDLVRFYRAVFDGDAKAIGERRPIGLRDRMLAGEWLAARGFGRAPVVVELPDAPAGSLPPEAVATVRVMPQELQDGIRRWLEQRCEECLAREREVAEAKMRSYLPVTGLVGTGTDRGKVGDGAWGTALNRFQRYSRLLTEGGTDENYDAGCSPCETAQAAICVRELNPSLLRICCT